MNSKIVQRVCFFSFVIFTCPGTTKKGPCLRFPNGCCPYTHWDSDSEQCVECQPGYFLENCSSMCPFPLFGKKCAESCSCEKQLCDFAQGCTDYNEQRSTLSIIKRNPVHDIDHNITKSVSNKNSDKDNWKNSTQCPKEKATDEKRNIIHTALIVISIVAGVFSLAYLLLLASEKCMVESHREEIVLNEIITA